MSSFARDYSSGLTLSVLGHAALLAVLGLRLVSLPAPEVPRVPLAIEATVIDAGALRMREQEAERRRAEAERARQAELQRQREAAEAERRRQEDAERRRRDAEQARIAAERKAEAERQEAERKAEAERKEAERRKAEEERRRAEEARIAEQRRKEEAERQRQEAERQRLEAERQAEFQRELAAEEQRLAAIASGAQARYLALIRDRVERNWARPASATPGIECVVHVTQIPGGEVVNVRVGRCNGDAGVVRSIIAAVEKSSPLPPASDPTLFDRNLRFTFKPEE